MLCHRWTDVRARRRSALAAGLLLCLPIGLWPGSGAAAETKIYRCTTAGGAIEFRQFPCHERDVAQEVDIRSPPVGWVPPKPESSAKDTDRQKKPRKTEKRSTDSKDKYADRCWKKQQQIDEIDARLRAGYRPEQGVKLRRRRAQHEDYISHFCR